MSIWCEHCRDHYEVDHYDDEGHLVGAEYGPVGEQLAAAEAAEGLSERVSRLLDVLAPLLDREFCLPFASAWELGDTDWRFPDGTKADGEKLHALMVEAIEGVRAALGKGHS